MIRQTWSSVNNIHFTLCYFVSFKVQGQSINRSSVKLGHAGPLLHLHQLLLSLAELGQVQRGDHLHLLDLLLVALHLGRQLRHWRLVLLILHPLLQLG